ncbi:polysaccharide biosynthesis/export family protein [Fibrobacter sp.]|uniref:polysaccharide biosynthesis/export family protein n=1 Tax=Fibrobacter sp. TaxID=35828 RepID=UPI00389078F7
MLKFLVLLLAVLCYGADDDKFTAVVPQFQSQDVKFQRNTVAQEPYDLEQVIDSSYVVGPGDFFEILSPKGFDVVQVSPEGNISVPSCGVVTVDKLSLSEAKAALKNMLVSKYDERYVQVQIVRMRKLQLSVLGAVAKPGHKVMNPQTRLGSAVEAFGGFQPLADKKHVKVYRDKDTLDIDYTLFESMGVDEVNLMLHSGDVVYVPYTTSEGSIAISTPVSSYTVSFVEGRTLGEYIDKLGGVVESKVRWAKVKKPDGSVSTYELADARDLRLEPKTEVELWSNEPFVYVGGAVTMVGKVPYNPDYHAIDYIATSGVSIVTGSLSRATRVRDGKRESIDPYKDDIKPGDFIEIPRSIYESVKDVTLFLASLLSVVATAIIISTY